MRRDWNTIFTGFNNESTPGKGWRNAFRGGSNGSFKFGNVSSMKTVNSLKFHLIAGKFQSWMSTRKDYSHLKMEMEQCPRVFRPIFMGKLSPCRQYNTNELNKREQKTFKEVRRLIESRRMLSYCKLLNE